MVRLFVTFLAVLSFAGSARAHFVYVVPDPGGTKAQVIFSDSLEPDKGVEVARIAGTKLFVRVGNKSVPLTLEQAEHAFVMRLPGDGSRLVYGNCEYGVLQRGDTRPFLLRYHPKAVVGWLAAEAATVGATASLEIVPVGEPGRLRFQVLAGGKPVGETEVNLLLPDGQKQQLPTDQAGLTAVMKHAGRLSLWARRTHTIKGEAGGKKYEEIREYATLVLDVAKTGAAVPVYPPLPEAVSSLGAAVSNGWLYVYGGHSGKSHQYSTETVRGSFRRLNLTNPNAWEELPGGPILQGLALVAYRDKIYRIGGMQPRNKPGEDADNHSVSACARFDPGTRRWEPLPDLPDGRSSHDAVVVGDQLVVVGGWKLNGRENKPTWHSTTLLLDLTSAAAEWRAVPQPFQRRALTAATRDGKVFVLAGLEPAGEPQRVVNIFDPLRTAWTTGLEIPGPRSHGFSPAACCAEGHLFLSTADGKIYRLNKAGDTWETVGQLQQPRFVHRLIADANGGLIAVGGASQQGNVARTERIAPDEKAPAGR